MILRARFVLPISSPPIENGAMRISGSRIVAVGTAKEISTPRNDPVCDLGDTILLPGLINAHCHLDYTEMAGRIPKPRSFPDWIKSLLALKAHWTYTEYANSWLRGARMLLDSGVTSVADIEAVPELLPDVWTSTPLRVISLLEMTGIRSRRSPSEILNETMHRISSLPEDKGTGGLSPHAPYSTTPELLQLTGKIAAEHHLRIAVHASESVEEYEMFANRQGALYDWLKNQRDMSDCGRGSPIQHLERQGLLGDNLLAIHVNYLGSGDSERLSSNRVNVVHCPRSHSYFGHSRFPYSELSNSNVNICLGTDSLVSVVSPPNSELDLSLFAEMQSFSSKNKNLKPERILRMATQSGATALGRRGEIGELSVNSLADLIAIPYTGTTEGVYDAVVHHTGKVAASMVNGIWAIQPSET